MTGLKRDRTSSGAKMVGAGWCIPTTTKQPRPKAACARGVHKALRGFLASTRWRRTPIIFPVPSHAKHLTPPDPWQDGQICGSPCEAKKRAGFVRMGCHPCERAGARLPPTLALHRNKQNPNCSFLSHPMLLQSETCNKLQHARQGKNGGPQTATQNCTLSPLYREKPMAAKIAPPISMSCDSAGSKPCASSASGCASACGGCLHATCVRACVCAFECACVGAARIFVHVDGGGGLYGRVFMHDTAQPTQPLVGERAGESAPADALSAALAAPCRAACKAGALGAR